MATVKQKITNSDPITGKRMIAFLTGAPISEYGCPLHVSFLVRLKEADEQTDAAPANTTDRAKKAVEAYEERFEINTRKISSVTKLYLPEDTTDVNAVTLMDYFADKVATSYPGVSGTSPLWEVSRGILREVIAIKQANGELPV